MAGDVHPYTALLLSAPFSLQALNTYKVYVTTGTLKGADFDGDVYITVSSGFPLRPLFTADLAVHSCRLP
jgi:hypothetical protein